MKTILVLTSCLALASLTLANDQDNNKKKKQSQGTPQPQHQVQHQKAVTPKGTQRLGTNAANQHHVSGSNKTTFNKTVNRPTLNKTRINNTTFNKTTFKGKHFNLSGNPNPSIQNVKFNANYHIAGSQNWHGQNYVVFRNYHPQWHDRGWWIGHHNHIVFVFGGWYFWDGGYYYPAWGYAPNAYYAYDGPIYTGSPESDPGQVVANVQSALQEQGFYQGEVDGILGPQTRGALADYQQAHGLELTGAVDEPTLESLGLA